YLPGQAPGAADPRQVVSYDLAHSAAAIETARAALVYGTQGPIEASLAAAFAADAVWDLAIRLLGREGQWGAEPGVLTPAAEFVARHRAPSWLASLAGDP